MNSSPHSSTSNRIRTDDLAFAAYLRTKGCHLIKADSRESKAIFTFEIDDDADTIRVDYINSEFVRFYNELRNLKKMTV